MVEQYPHQQQLPVQLRPRQRQAAEVTPTPEIRIELRQSRPRQQTTRLKEWEALLAAALAEGRRGSSAVLTVLGQQGVGQAQLVPRQVPMVVEERLEVSWLAAAKWAQSRQHYLIQYQLTVTGQFIMSVAIINLWQLELRRQLRTPRGCLLRQVKLLSVGWVPLGVGPAGLRQAGLP